MTTHSNVFKTLQEMFANTNRYYKIYSWKWRNGRAAITGWPVLAFINIHDICLR